MLPEEPWAISEEMVWVAPEGKVTVFGAPIVTVLKVLAPVMMTAPEPPPVMERLL